jgi:CHASE3 domain sensor protein
MKNALVVLIFLIAVAAVTWGIWTSHKSSTKVLESQAPSTVPAQVVKPFHPPPSSNFLAVNEWQELRSVRETTLKNNPDLAAEYKALLAEMDEQQKDLEAAMIKADPKVAPIVAKLEALRKHNSVSYQPVVGR